jgi:hypothetical protein
MQHCFCPGFFSLSLVLAAVACGGDDRVPAQVEPGAQETPAVDGEGTGLDAEGRLFPIALDGDSQIMLGQARVEVVELMPTVKFTLTAVYPGNATDLLLLQLALPGVESVAGPHTFELGRPYVAPAFAIVAVNGEAYSSRDGTFELTLEADGALQGHFDAGFSKDAAEGDGPALPARDVAVSSTEALRLSGSFEGSWSVLCRSPVPSLPGDHSVSNSQYCKNLEF